MIKKISIFVLLFFFAFGAIHAQDAQTRASVMPAVNKIITGINMLTYRTRIYPKFYGQYYRRYLKTEKDFKGPFHKKDFRIWIKKTRFQDAKESVKHLPGNWPDIFQKDLEALDKLQVSEPALNDSLEILTKDQALRGALHKEVKEKVFRLMITYPTEHKVLMEKIYRQLTEISSKYPKPDKSNPWVRSGDLMLESIENSLKVLAALKKEQPPQVYKRYLDRVDSIASTLKSGRDELLQGLKTYPGNGIDPYSNFDWFVRELTKFANSVRTYKKTYRHSHHNTALLHYNNVVGVYNRFVVLSADSTNQKVPPAFLIKHIYKKWFVKIEAEESESDQPDAGVKEQERKPRELVSEVRKPQQKAEKPSRPLPNNITENLNMEGFRPNNLILLLDVSGSMNKPGRLPLFKEALKQVSSIMRKEDVFTVVLYSNNAQVLFERKPFTSKKVLKQLLALSSKGKTNAILGIEKAYQLANQAFDASQNNRILMITDGDFTLPHRLFQTVKSHNERVQFSVFDFGERKGKNDNLRHLAKFGKGSYVPISQDNHISALLYELRAK
ncbi:hypothetical protein FUAX_43430 (plasmid) [Fulvitalea axinellae]|uniref:VWFA domain-containing protein n=1 Tax=Fulvitalea axinellae TaxID=1182444 RepID=A0AAU9CRY7_9BACT|nr:hypothetical protein FUAX_43430 [Fulvitalea axinellae]